VFSLYACPRCRRARLVEPGRKTASCGSCSQTLQLADLHPQWIGASLDEGRRMLGAVNARLDGREAEFAAGLVPPPPVMRRHDDAHEAAAATARGGKGEAAKVDRIARALGDELVEFQEVSLRIAMRLAGLDGARSQAHMLRMVRTDVLYEVRPDWYRPL
jgi:hypothetical protein